MARTQVSPVCQRFGRRICALRKAHNMPQKELAFGVGISQSTLCRIEKGRSEPPIFIAMQLARVLECSLDELLREEPPALTITIQ